MPSPTGLLAGIDLPPLRYRVKEQVASPQALHLALGKG